ncbi:hypothetical protein HYT84_04615 [Candidatus Micrarchaeota archaeon]|nr:hypothetical protein [Candidatus Micrarchaeota archaeon]
MKDGINIEKIGELAFTVGMIIVFVVGILTPFVKDWQVVLLSLLTILGFLVGMLNISPKETTQFLVAAIAIMLSAGTLGIAFGSGNQNPNIGVAITGYMQAVAAFIAPAASVVAIGAIKRLASAR